MYAEDMINKLAEISMRRICSEVAQESEEEMTELNEQQLSMGLRSDGSEIEPFYSIFTLIKKEMKSGLAGVSDRVTLFDTGAHYRGLYTEVAGSVIEWGSKDPKSKKLEEKYGKIYGLNDYSKEILKEETLQPGLVEAVNKFIGKKS